MHYFHVGSLGSKIRKNLINIYRLTYFSYSHLNEKSRARKIRIKCSIKTRMTFDTSRDFSSECSYWHMFMKCPDRLCASKLRKAQKNIHVIRIFSSVFTET